MSLSTSPLSPLPQQSATRQAGPKAAQPETTVSAKPSDAGLEPQDSLTRPAQSGSAATSLDLSGPGHDDRNLLARIDSFNQELKLRRPDLIERKFSARAESPFAFFRATDFLFFQDLKNNPAIAAGPMANLRGDWSLVNPGIPFAGQGRSAGLQGNTSTGPLSPLDVLKSELSNCA